MEYLTSHQRDAVTRLYELFNHPRPYARGLLEYHPMGSGKSFISAYSLVRELLNGRRPVFFSNRGIRDNMMESIIKYIHQEGLVVKNLSKIRYVSLNASNLPKRLAELGNLDGELVVVDEAHNLFRGVANLSPTLLALYRKLMNHKVRLCFLTGTPIAHEPVEILVCFDLLLGRPLYGHFYSDPQCRPSIETILGFVSKHKNLIDYADFSEIFDRLPELLPMKEVFVPMTAAEYKLYRQALTRDKAVPNRTYDNYANFRVQSRIACNTVSKMEEVFEYVLSFGGAPGMLYSTFVQKGGVKALAAFFREKGWVDKTPARSLNKSEDVDSTRLSDLDDVTPLPVPRTRELSFAVINGGVHTTIRSRIIKTFSSPENMYGDLINLLIISSVGGEGLSCNNLRFSMMFEGTWNPTTEQQFIGRSRRLDSHILLPPEERNVQPFMFISTPPEYMRGTDPTSDQVLLQISKNRRVDIKAVEAVLSY